MKKAPCQSACDASRVSQKARRRGPFPATLPPMRYTLIVSLAVLAAGGSSRAWAEGTEGQGAYVSAGLGAGGEGLAGLVSLGYREDDRLITVRVAKTEELNIFGPSPSQSRSDASVLYGLIMPGRGGFTAVSAGLGVVHSVSRGEYVRSTGAGFFGPVEHERISRTTVGLALSGKAVLSTRHAGVGLEAFGNVNPKASFVGLALTLDVGKLR
jgi:hypothetical protein